ncbi:MAG: hypothetical protein BGO09_03610 [Bacteroidetes bacterium 47-18]|nr:MAG: hypothetical protein BGO09_03610 [Bacteroidetes bacterium 47-18]
MNVIHHLLIAILLLYAAPAYSQAISAVSAVQLNERLNAGTDTIYVVNYWATWCIPCVKELPALEKIQEQYKDKPVKVLLVSFDFKEQYPEQLEKWVQQKQLKSEVVWMNESVPDEFIPRLNNDWSGSLPATTILYKRKTYRYFTEASVTYKELDGIIRPLLK